MSKIRTGSGQIRRKREDMLIRSIEERYDVDFNVRSDMKLGTYLKSKGLPSLAKALDMVSKKR